MDDMRDDFNEEMEEDMIDALDEEEALLDEDEDLDEEEDEDKLLGQFGLHVEEDEEEPEF
jgi:hypothetical protein